MRSPSLVRKYDLGKFAASDNGLHTSNSVQSPAIMPRFRISSIISAKVPRAEPLVAGDPVAQMRASVHVGGAVPTVVKTIPFRARGLAGAEEGQAIIFAQVAPKAVHIIVEHERRTWMFFQITASVSIEIFDRALQRRRAGDQRFGAGITFSGREIQPKACFSLLPAPQAIL